MLYGVLHLLQLLLVGSDCNEQCDSSRAYCLQNDVKRDAIEPVAAKLSKLAAAESELQRLCKNASQQLSNRGQESIEDVSTSRS